MLFSYSMYVWLEQCWNLISWSDLFLSSTLAADLLFLWQLLKVWLSRGLLVHQLTKTIKILLQTFNFEIDFCKSSFKQGHLSSQHGLEFSKHSTLVNTVSCTKHKVIKGYFIEKTADNWQQLGIVMSAFLFLNKRIYPYITDYSMWFSFIYDMAARILQMYVFSLSWTLLCWGDPQWEHLHWLRSFVFEPTFEGLYSATHSFMSTYIAPAGLLTRLNFKVTKLLMGTCPDGLLFSTNDWLPVPEGQGWRLVLKMFLCGPPPIWKLHCHLSLAFKEMWPEWGFPENSLLHE